jgi:hypothetical protein
MAKQLAQEADLYDRDFYTWALRQAELVRARRLGELDLENIAEELRSLGSEQEHRLESSYRVLLMHLLKWVHQPQRRGRSWRATIVRERINAARTWCRTGRGSRRSGCRGCISGWVVRSARRAPARSLRPSLGRG